MKKEVRTWCEGCSTWRLNTVNGVLSRTVNGVTDYPTGKSAARAAATRKARHQAALDLGLVRVRGALGGIYYE